MSVKQVKDICVTCPNGHQITIPKEVWNHDVVEQKDKFEHGSGTEVHHQYSVEGYTCDHPGCSKPIDATVDVWEYPNGAIETSDKSENVVGKVDDCFESQLD